MVSTCRVANPRLRNDNGFMNTALALAVALVAAFFAAVRPAVAAGTEPGCDGVTGTAIMQRVHDRDRGNRAIQSWRMTLENARGERRERTVRMLYMDFEGGLQRRLIRFLAPADIRRTTFLNIEVEDGLDDQYLYLPAYERVKRIANTERSRSFMGTDYTYEDILTRDVDADRHTCVGSGELGEWRTWRVRSVPLAGSNSQYRLMEHQVDRGSAVVVETLFYADGDEAVKQFGVRAMERFDGVWVVTDSTMTNLEEGHGTRIEVTGVRFDHPQVVEGLFTVQRLDTPRLPGIE